MPNRKEAPKGSAHGREKEPSPWRAPRPGAPLLGVAAALLAGALYLPALRFGWVWDDARLLAGHGAGAEGFHPFLDFLGRGEWMLGAGNPTIFHLTSVLLHAVGTWLFFRLARHLGAGPGAAFFASLLFAFHPVHVESVAYVTGRAALAATVLALGSLLAARTARLCSPEGCRSQTIWWAYALYALAALSDEAALVVPFLLMGLDRWGPTRVPAKQRRVHYAGFMAILLVAILLRFAEPARHAATILERGIPAGMEAPAILLSIGATVRLLAWPHPLNAMHGLSAAEAASAASWAGLAVAVTAVGAFVWWRRRDPLARVGALTLALGLVPTLPFPGFAGNFVSERAAYLPSVGFCLLLASLLAWLFARATLRLVGSAAAILAAGAAAAASTARLPVWRDNISLLQAAAAADPTDPKPYLELARQHIAAGDAVAALAALDRAAQRDSTIEEIALRRTLVLGSLGRWPEAEAAARRAASLRPGDSQAWTNLANVLIQEGKAAEAVEASRRSVGLDAAQTAGWYNLGVALAATGDPGAAIEAYHRALAIDSTFVEAWNNVGALYGGRGDLERARDAYLKAVDLSPTSIQARMNLALAYLRLGQGADASRERQIIERMDPAASRRLDTYFDSAVGKGSGAPGSAAKH